MILFFLFGIAHASTVWNPIFDSKSIFFGVDLQDPQTYQRNASDPMVPASNAKVLVAGEFLKLLGKDFQYQTEVQILKISASRASLILIGEGDPSWGMTEFGSAGQQLESMADALVARGIQEIAGPIQLISKYPQLDAVSFPKGWKTSDFLGCGGSLAQSFNYDINCSTLEVISPSKFRWVGSENPTPVILQLKPGKTTSVSVELLQQPYRYVVKGSWKAGSPKKLFYLPIYDTKPWIQKVIEQKLLDKGIRMVNTGEIPVEKEVLVFKSPPAAELLKPFLKNSVNFLGDAFVKSLGVHSRLDSSTDALESGLEALLSRLRPLIGEVELYDGSGLTRIGKIKASQMFRYLENMREEGSFQAFLEALSVAGIDGTLKNRMKGTPAQGNVRGKTGTLDGVYNLSGYVSYDSAWIPFVFFTRTTTSQASQARSTLDKAGSTLANRLGNQGKTDFPIYPFRERNSGEFWIDQGEDPYSGPGSLNLQ